MKPLFVSYYTEGAGYEKYLKAHEESLQNFNLEYVTYKLPRVKTWKEGGHLITLFLLEMLKKFQRPLCYIDIDSIIVDDPLPKLQISEDIGYCYHFIDKKSGYAVAEGSDIEVLSGTLFVNPTPGAVKFIKKWDELIQKNKELNDQQLLERLLLSPQESSVTKLHQGLCAIEETHDYLQDQYIRHFQASRGKEHPLSIASSDPAVEEQAARYGYNYISAENLLRDISEPTLILGKGAQIHRPLFNAEKFEKEIALAIHSDGSVIETKALYITPTEAAFSYLQTKDPRPFIKRGLVERIPSSYWSSYVKSPTISFVFNS